MRRNVWLMYGIALLQGMVFYGPIATLYRQAQGISVLQITVIESISLLLCLLLELPWGVVADRIGYKKSMVIACMLYFVSKIVFWQADDFAGFLLERVMLSVVIAGMSGVETSILYLSAESGKTQKSVAVYQYLQTCGLLFAALFYAVAIGENFARAGFCTVLSYGAAALLSLGLCEVKEQRASVSEAGRQTPGDQTKTLARTAELKRLLHQLMHNRSLLALLIGIAFLNETHQTITVFLSQLQYIRSGMQTAHMGYVYIGITVAGLCGIWSAELSGKLRERRCAVLLYGLMIAACLLLCRTDGAVLSVLAMLALRVAFSLFQPLQTELQNRQVQTEDRATALSVNAIVIDSIGVLTNVLFGRLADVDLRGAFVFGAVLCSAGLLLFLYGCRGLFVRDSRELRG